MENHCSSWWAQSQNRPCVTMQIILLAHGFIGGVIPAHLMAHRASVCRGILVTKFEQGQWSEGGRLFYAAGFDCSYSLPLFARSQLKLPASDSPHLQTSAGRLDGSRQEERVGKKLAAAQRRVLSERIINPEVRARLGLQCDCSCSK